MKVRNDLLDEHSPSGIDAVQLTTNGDLNSCHIYMEAQIFTPDSKQFLLHQSAHAHGSDKNDPNHKYLICDIENDCALYPITEEVGATAPSISPDGNYVYYFVKVINAGEERALGPLPVHLLRIRKSNNS